MDDTTGTVTVLLGLLLTIVICGTQGVRCNRDDNTLNRARAEQLAHLKASCIQAGRAPLECDKLTL